MLPSFAQAFATENMSTTLPPIRKRPVIDDDTSIKKRRTDLNHIRKNQEALIEHRRDNPTDDPLPSSSSSRLPSPPISFANRAINAGKKKPADLRILNPRPNRHLAFHRPSSAVQSAPPTQNSFSFPMALPTLPPNLISSGPIAGSGRVPPTPTRFTTQSTSYPATIPIATTLVPQTPTTLIMNTVSRSLPQNNSTPSTSNSSAGPPTAPISPAAAAQAKHAFLAPFELFYDALHDASQLKDWLNDQLTRSALLMKSWEEHHPPPKRAGPIEKSIVKREQIDPDDGELGVRDELDRLRKRVEHLEARLGLSPTVPNGTTTTATSSSSSHDGTNNEPASHHQREYRREPLPPLPAISARLTVTGRPELGRRLSSPGWQPSRSNGGPSYRVVGKRGGDPLAVDMEEAGRGLGVSKSLSGPGAPGGVQFASESRSRRASISGGPEPEEREDGPRTEDKVEKEPEVKERETETEERGRD